MKSSSNIRPNVFDKVGDGTWFYNYNIVELNTADGTIYNYDKVRVKSIDDNTLKEVVIREKYTASQEANLINNCRRYDMKLSADIALKNKYIDYLRDVDAIKAMIENDLVNHSSNLQ